MAEEQPSGMRAVSKVEALHLLASVPYGRIVFTRRALPAIHPVTHVFDNGDVLVSGIPGAAGQIVAYEADHISDGLRLDWTVVVIGMARPEDDVLRIRPELVTGYVAAAGDLPATA